MKKLLILAILALSGCATYSALTGAAITPQSTVVAINSFDVLEVVATGYLQLTPCVKGGLLACRNAAVVAKIVPAVRAGRFARDQLVGLLQANGGASIPVASFDTLAGINATLQNIYATYNIH